MKKYLFLTYLVLISWYAGAQYFQTGQDPASIKWRQINTQNFQLIYPDYYEDDAQILAQKLEKVYNYASFSLHHKPEKISILLHTQTVQSNGLVAYAPKRSEFFTTPNQGIYPLDWLEQLAVHEFRHVVQIDKMNSELPKIISILMGEQGTALVFGAYLPWWFIEGDAVVTETALSHYGRGRFPSFLMEHRAQVVEKGTYSYDKAYLGSFKDYVPNHYNLGYYMVANSRARYGSELWEKVITRVGEKPFSLTPFNTELKKQTGFNKVQMYNSIFDSLANVWQANDREYPKNPVQVLSEDSKTYTDYTFGHWLDNREIVAYRTGLNCIPAFVKIDKSGNETVLHHPGIIFDESINSEGEWLVWSERIPDLRWSHSGRSKINLLNINTGEKISFTPELKAFAPAISPDISNVAMVEADFSSRYYLTVYNIFTGKSIHRLQTSDNNYLLSPVWENEKNILCVILTGHGKRLARFDTDTGSYQILNDLELGDIRQLQVKNNNLYFIATLSGIDALYKYDLKTGQTDCLYEPRFGVAYPDVDNNGRFLLSNYTAGGYRLIEVNQPDNTPLDSIVKENFPLAQVLARQEPGIPDLTTSDTIHYQTEEYNKTRHLLNFHSWAPVFVDPYQYEFKPGASLMSQNILGTAETVLGYKWNTSEKTGQFYASYVYKGWYPVLGFNISSGKRSSYYNKITEHIFNGEVVSRDTVLTRFTWNETRLNASVKFPLNFSHGMFFRLLQPEIKYAFTHTNDDSSTPSAFQVGNYHSFSYRIYYHQLLRRSYQDVWPNFGVIVDGSYHHSPFGTLNLGTETGGQGILYLPGFLANHGTKLYLGLQDRTGGDHYGYADIIRFPRGWAKVLTKRLSVFGIDYKLPLLNPDLSIGGLSYIRRVNTTLFYDYAGLTRYHYEDGQITGTYSQNISSTGIELIGDMNFLRFYAPVQLGFRTSYLPEINDYSFDFLFSIDFNAL